MEKTPKQIYIDYKRNIIDQGSAAEQILFLFDRSDINRERIECLEILCKIRLRVEKIFKFLENLLITDVDENIRISSAKCLKNLFLEKAFLPIKWAYLYEKSIFCLMEYIDFMIDIAIKTRMRKVYSFLLDQVKKIDIYQFRNSLGLNVEDETIANLSLNKLAKIIKNYVLIKHFSEFSSNFTYRLKIGLISKLDLGGINKNVFGWNIVKKSFDLIKIFESLEEFDLKDNRITEIPISIRCLNNLRYLNLSYNDLQLLPESIGSLINLKYLFLSHNKITKLPYSISKLVNLSVLNLRHNSLMTVPKELNNLTNLRNLDLHGNGLKNLEDSKLNLKSLKRLDLGLNKIKIIPKWLKYLDSLRILNLGSNKVNLDFNLLSQLKNLSLLNISDNNIKELPEDIGLMNSLVKLNLSNNQLTSIPHSIVNLNLLRNLNLSWNNFISLPDWISSLSSLEHLNLRGNNLKELPSSLETLPSLRVLNLKLNNGLRKISNSLQDLKKRGLKIYI